MRSILWMAASIGDLPSIRSAADASIDLKDLLTPTPNGVTLLMEAVRGERYQIVEFLLDLKEEHPWHKAIHSTLNQRAEEGKTAAYQAAERGDWRSVKALAEAGAN